MRSLVSGERMRGVAGHGVLGEEGAEKVGGSLWRWPWMPDAEVESVHRGQWEISGLLEMAETGPGRPLKDGLCRRGRPLAETGPGRPLKDSLCRRGRPLALVYSFLRDTWEGLGSLGACFKGKTADPRGSFGSRNRNRDTCLLAQNT